MKTTAIFGAALLGAATWLAAVGPSQASDARGVWLREDGKAKVKFSNCGGENLCGTIVWLREKDSSAQVGQKVFFDMEPTGENIWTGSAFNPEDGKNYDGKMVLRGASLKTSGCALAGLICKSFNWSRAD